MKFLYPGLIFCLFLLSCSSDTSSNNKSKGTATGGKIFTKLSNKSTGIDFQNTLREDVDSDFNILSFDFYFNGAGVALGDINNDGLSDIFFTANTGPDKLYLNKGNLKFEDITQEAGIKAGNWSTGVNMVDVNKDGLVDIYVCQAGPDNTPGARNNLLYINKGNNKFQEEAARYGLADPRLSMQAAFFDFNKDGLLDCYVMNESKYVRMDIELVLQDLKDINKLSAASGVLYKNVGGQFVDVSREAGIMKYGFGLGLVVSDFNNDSWPDFYVANDYSAPDMMWINQKNGTFKDEIKKRTNQTSWFSMGIDVADINNDGHLDIGVVDMSTQDHFYGKTLMAPMNPALFKFTHEDLNYQRQHMFNALQINQGNGTYSNIAGMTKTLSTEWSWASLFADFDNDGDKDYFVSNGYKRCHRDNDFQIKLKATSKQYNKNIPSNIKQELYDEIPTYKSKNMMFENNGYADFENVAAKWGVDDVSFSNGAVYGDLDNDGDLDLVVNNIDDYAFVYENNTNGNHLRMEFQNQTSALGTRVYVYTGEQKQLQEYNPVRGYQSKVEDKLHFGIGKHSKIDSVIVLWPNRKIQKLFDVDANQTIKLELKNASNQKFYRNSGKSVLFAEANKIDFRHQENEFDDFKKEILLPYKQSTLGPFITKADVDKNGYEDFYVGGAKGQSGALHLQFEGDVWKKSSASTFRKHAGSEDMKSHFFDADGDGDLDLYVVSGGSEFKLEDPLLQDRLYKNDGKGNFSDNSQAIPKLKFSGMKVSSADYDADGDLDIFVSGRIVPQKYPYAPKSVLLENKNGKFVESAATKSGAITEEGIINDAIWVDIDDDKDMDLIIAGEWTNIKLFENQDGEFAQKSVSGDLAGWWYSLKAVDVDNDGDKDIIAGNLGLNSKFSASKEKPFSVFADDFDGNGTCDVVLSKYYKGEQVPVRGRQCSSEQMPYITEKFETYSDFAKTNINDMLGIDKVSEALKLNVNTFESAVFVNNGNGNFTSFALPKQAQAFPIWGIESSDLNHDGFQDLILTGNLYGMEIETPRIDAGRGLVLLNDKEGNFEPLSPQESGILINGDLRDVALLSAPDKKILITTRNNDHLTVHHLKE